MTEPHGACQHVRLRWTRRRPIRHGRGDPAVDCYVCLDCPMMVYVPVKAEVVP